MTGKELAPLKYDRMDDFSEGLALVEFNGKYGFIDTTGKEVIPLKYDWGDDFVEGSALVAINHKFFYIDKTGKKIRDYEE